MTPHDLPNRRPGRFPAAAVLATVLALAVGPAPAQPALSCRQLGSVAGSPMPRYGDTADIALIVGDHYWACPCGETRRLVGDNEQRRFAGDSEHRTLVGDNEQRRFVGDNENRQLVGDNEQRRLVGDNEQRHLVGDNEHRTLVGDAGGLQCRKDPGCAGFTLLGAPAGPIQVVARGGLRPADASCIVPY